MNSPHLGSQNLNWLLQFCDCSHSLKLDRHLAESSEGTLTLNSIPHTSGEETYRGPRARTMTSRIVSQWMGLPSVYCVIQYGLAGGEHVKQINP